MVTIIHFTFANLKLTQSCILAFVGVDQQREKPAFFCVLMFESFVNDL